MIWLKARRKFLVATAGAVLELATLAFGASNTWVILAEGAATALGVYRVPNK